MVTKKNLVKNRKHLLGEHIIPAKRQQNNVNPSILPSAPFQLSDIFLAISCLLFLLWLVQEKILTIAPFFKQLPYPQSIQILLAFLLQEILILLPIILILVLRYTANFTTAFSLHATPWKKIILSVGKWYGWYLICSFLFGIILQLTKWKIPGYGEGTSIIPIFGKDPFTIPIVIIVICIIAPLVEELFFRGFLFLTLWKRMSFLSSSLITSLLFSAMHLDFAAFFPRFILSLILNQLVRENNRSILPSILFHVMNNSIAVLVTFFIDK